MNLADAVCNVIQKHNQIPYGHILQKDKVALTVPELIKMFPFRKWSYHSVLCGRKNKDPSLQKAPR